jgi:hypothetical protein
MTSISFGLFLVLAVALATTLVAAAAFRRHPTPLADLSILPVPFALWWLPQNPNWHPGLERMLDRMEQPGATRWLAPMAAVGAFGFAALCRAWPAARKKFICLVPGNLYQWAMIAAAGLFGLLAIHSSLEVIQWRDFWLTPILLAAGLAVAALTRWPGVLPAFWCGTFYCFYGYIRFMANDDPYRSDQSLRFLWIMLPAAAAMLTLALMARAWRPDLSARILALYEFMMATLTLLTLLFLFGRQRGDLATFTTVFWGLSAVTIFIAGLARRTRPVRIVSLAGLAACIARIFLIDAHSSLARIFAFVGVGIVLLVVGFLYSKFGGRIAPDAAVPPAGNEP